MKKIFTLVAATMMAVMAVAADNGKAKFEYEAGAEVVSSYIWRGLYNGGLSFQPSAAVGFVSNSDRVRFKIGAWGSVGASDWKFRKGFAENENGNPNTYFIPEFDLSAELQVYGLVLGATHYYYFGGTPFFSSRNVDGGSQTEVMVGLRFGDFCKASGLYFNWNMMVAGNDAYYTYKHNKLGEVTDTVSHRAWSTYIELGYEAEFEHDITLNVCVGLTPWRSLYTDYQGTIAVNNISLRFGKTWNVKDVVDIELFALGSMNTYKINKHNCFEWKAGDDKLGSAQRLNGTIGLGFWF